MEHIITYIPQTLLLVKYDTWGDYKAVGQIPSSFLDLVKLFSARLYPNDFSINFLDTNFNNFCIDNENKYNELVYICKGELKLMINIYKEQSCKRLRYHCETIFEENSSGFSSNCDSGKKLENLMSDCEVTGDFRLDSSITLRAKNKTKKRDTVKKNKGGIECY
jgi:hypothetical protein